MSDEYRYVGKPLPRTDALKKVTGRALFGADYAFPRQLWAAVHRSPHAHARIKSVDVSEAKAVPGVRLVLTGKDVPVLFGQFMRDQPVLAIDRVRYHGEPVAIAAADSYEAARTAMEKVRVEYEPLTPVRNLDDALAENAVLVHEDWKAYQWSSAAKPTMGTNICDTFHMESGDVDAALEAADFVVEKVYDTAMLQHATMETHAATVLYDESDGLTIWTPSQSPFMLQAQLAEVFALPQTKVRLITTEIGGAFGNKYELRAEPLAAILALRLPGRPIKLVFERHEEFTATGVRAPCRIYIRTGCTKDGTLTAQDTTVYWDTGAYVTTGPRVNYNAGFGASTPYKIPNARVNGYCVMTNKPLGTAYRGFGATEVAFGYESQMDMLADRCGMDPVAFRLKNLLDEGEKSTSGEVVTSVGVKDCLRAAAEAIGWQEDQRVTVTPEGKLRAKGVACFSKITGTPSNSSVILKFNTDSTVMVMQGGKEMGQGVETIIPQMVAEAMGLPVENVVMAPVDTLYSAFEKTTTGSRLTFHVGQAVLGACEDMKAQIRTIAGEFWKIPPEDVEVAGGFIREKGGEGRTVPLVGMAKSGMLKEQKPVIGRCSRTTADIFVPPDKVTGTSPRPAAMWFWGAQAAEVEVDPGTGQITVLRMSAGHDVGKAINPVNCEQQITGSIIMGVGSALTEEMIFDKDARLLNGNLVDFKVPTSRDAVPVAVRLIEKPHPEGPFGAKGIGEPGLVPTAAAIANAVARATGVRLYRLPMKPEEMMDAMGGARHADAL